METPDADDLDPLEAALTARLSSMRRGSPSPLDPLVAATLFESQVTSRLLDHTARWLRAQGHGHYTIGSAGHESNAAVALATRPSDPALLHYRSGGFYVARAGQSPGGDAVGDVLRGMLARTTEPIAGGRHKVFGRRDLNIIPQTSTIASHLPRAVGLALAIGGRGAATDDIVVCSFGDASLNHSTAQGALNWAAHSAFRNIDVPLLFVCEDNGLGISVPSPAGWVDDRVRRLGLDTVSVSGDDPAALVDACEQVVSTIRSARRPALLHLRTVRFLAHAGSDAEAAYRSPADIRADYARDPIAAVAQALIDGEGATPAELVDWYFAERADIRRRALEVLDEPTLVSAEHVMAPIVTVSPERVRARSAELSDASAEAADSFTLAQTINGALADVLRADPTACVFGEDVGRKGGVYGVTRGLQRAFGEARVFDTLLDEQSILGLALGVGVHGGLPIPEIQYLAYLHNAEDQLRGEAATLQFFSQGQYRNPMVVRVAAYAYQRGFGGHFHNDNSIAVLRDIPGLVIASPAHPSDAGPMLRTCAAAADVDGAVCVFLEPIARYHTTDLFEGDGEWTAPRSADHAAIGRARVHGDGGDVTIATWGNGLWLSLRAQRRLADDHGIGARVIDLRWLAPMPVGDLVEAAAATGRVYVADETRRSGGVSEGVIATLIDAGFRGAIGRGGALDSFVPLGEAANLVLLSEDQIVSGVVELMRNV